MNKDVPNSKTKKIRENKHDKKLLWDQFNQECNNEEKPLECIYRKTGQRENCAGCEANLSITDERFLACTNINCGIVYS